ncbi:hypothetical protein FRC02_011110 [Tulasnella sp. 418]|nr:hypothetical protein FRC02_011110 [Tulasnella sp. 418]
MQDSSQTPENPHKATLAPSATLRELANRDRLTKWESLYAQQAVLFRDLAEENAVLTKRVEELERDLRVWRVGVEHTEHEKEELAAKVLRLETSLHSLQNDNPLIVCLMDGDGAIFSEDLLIRGREGGRQAAAILTHTIKGYLNHESSTNYTLHSYQIYAAIYYNGPGLRNILIQNKVCDMKDFTEFVEGFNQATPLFTLVDVGGGKEAADAKLKESLRLFIRLPQTQYVFFGGAHDNGYLHTLRSFQTEGLLHKIIILKGNSKMARDVETYIDEMSIAIAECPDLFLRLKLKPRPGLGPSAVESTSGGRTSPNKAQRHNIKKTTATPSSSIAGNDIGSDLGDLSPAVTPVVQSGKVFRPIDPTKCPVLYISSLNDIPNANSEKPPPCNNYYITTCKRGSNCPYGHDYLLTPEQLESLRETVKKTVPCPDVNANKPCLAGNTCPFAHSCPGGPNCWHLKQGKCRFKGEYAHKVVQPEPVDVTEF